MLFRPTPRVAQFQSTSPVRGTTAYGMDATTAYQISIHVPREGDDNSRGKVNNFGFDFNPRPP